MERCADLLSPDGRLTNMLPSADTFAAEEQAKARLAAIVESSDDAIIGKNLDGIITDWNSSAERIFGYSAEEAIGRHISMLIPGDRWDEEERILKRIANGERVERFETLRRAKDGRLVHIALTVSPIRDETGRIVGASKIAQDVGDRIRAANALLESEGRLRAVFETAVDGIITIDEMGRITSLNPAALRIFGYTSEEMLGKNVRMLMPSPYQEAHDGYLLNYLRTGVKKIIGIGREVTGRRKDGSLFPVELGVSETVVGNRRIFTGIIRDISERKQAELASERLLHLLGLANIMVRGAGDRITHWNKGAENLYGYTAGEAIGTISHELLKTRFPEKKEIILERLWSTGHWEGELVHTAKDGRQIAVATQWTIYPGQTGEPPAVVEANFDVTAWKAAEKGLRESEERFRNLFSAMSEGFCLGKLLYDDKGKPNDFRFLVVNPAYRKILGMEPEEIVGRRAREILPDLEEYWIDALAQPVLTGQPVRYSNYVKELDRHFDVYVYSPEKDLFAALTLDVTDRKQFEQTLAKQAEALARSNVELERFAYVASHDLQEPLRTIASFAKLLQRRHASALDDEAREYLQFITGGVERLETLIRDLLNYSRIDSRGAPFTAVDCGILVGKVIASLNASIESGKVQITVDKLPTVQGDSTQLGQLFQNLLSNAIKFCKEGPPQIQISAAENPTEWIFSVRDNGIGIDPKYFDRIFVIFQRLHTMEEYGGTGIGLAVCKKIVDRHKGRIWVESEGGKGSTFYFSVPKPKGAA